MNEVLIRQHCILVAFKKKLSLAEIVPLDDFLVKITVSFKPHLYSGRSFFFGLLIEALASLNNFHMQNSEENSFED